MTFTRTLRTAAQLLAASAALAWAGSGIAQGNAANYPSEPVRVVVPYVAGGATDIIGRVFAQAMGKELDQTFVVENKPGAGQAIGTAAVARAPAHGYPLRLGTGTHAITETLVDKLPYDSKKDFALATILASSPMVCVVPATLGIKSLDELVDAARQDPDKFAYASSGAGSPGQLSVEAIKHAAGINMLHIPYKGAAQTITDLMSGRVHFLCVSPIPIMAQLEDGSLIPLAVTSAERTSVLPDVPTVRETGLDADVIESWYGIIAPAGTPEGILERLYQAARASLQDEQVKATLEDNGLKAVVNTPEQAETYLDEEIVKWRNLIEAANIKHG